MNERIRLLAEQAGFKSAGELFGQSIPEYAVPLEKFAELIVQECVNVLHDNELWNRHISHALNEHFGVEQ